MECFYLEEIYLYPVKSLGGVSVELAEVESTGLKHDRRWMLTDRQGNFLSQRTFAQLALMQAVPTEAGLHIVHKKGLLEPLLVPYPVDAGKPVNVTIWDDVCSAFIVSPFANEWFSEVLSMPVRLVYMPSSTHRLVDTNYANDKEVVSFADAFPLLIIGQSSLNDLNKRLSQPVLMNRFRPNLVFRGGNAFSEDTFDEFQINTVRFRAAKPCSRCTVVTINQEDGSISKEPLQTLSTYRKRGNKIMFGQNLLHCNAGTIKKGDRLEVKSWKIPGQ